MPHHRRWVILNSNSPSTGSSVAAMATGEHWIIQMARTRRAIKALKFTFSPMPLRTNSIRRITSSPPPIHPLRHLLVRLLPPLLMLPSAFLPLASSPLLLAPRPTTAPAPLAPVPPTTPFAPSTRSFSPCPPPSRLPCWSSCHLVPQSRPPTA